MSHTSENIAVLYEKYVDMIYRISFMFLKNPVDSEEAVQNVFLKYIEKEVEFKNVEHEKAWFIVTTQNHCKNLLKHWWRKNIEFDGNLHGGEYEDRGEGQEIIENVLMLPTKFKLPIYMYYYEGYSTDEIARILEINPSTLRSRLKKGRELLKISIGGVDYE